MSIFDDVLIRANELLDKNQSEAAFALFLEAAKQKKRDSYNTIGYMLDHGIGVSQDKTAARQWYKKAARSGDYLSYHNLGLCYFENKKIELAKKWLLKAMENEHYGSAVYLSKIYMNENKNVHLAKKYATIARDSIYTCDADKEEAINLLKHIKKITSRPVSRVL